MAIKKWEVKERAFGTEVTSCFHHAEEIALEDGRLILFFQKEGGEKDPIAIYESGNWISVSLVEKG